MPRLDPACTAMVIANPKGWFVSDSCQWIGHLLVPNYVRHSWRLPRVLQHVFADSWFKLRLHTPSTCSVPTCRLLSTAPKSSAWQCFCPACLYITRWEALMRQRWTGVHPLQATALSSHAAPAPVELTLSRPSLLLLQSQRFVSDKQHARRACSGAPQIGCLCCVAPG
jgi:hypothetical protein